MSDLRTALENASAAGKLPPPAPAPAPAAPAAPAAAPVAAAPAAPASVERARDESGKFAPKAEPVAAVEATPSGTATPPKYKPPQSWKPAVREKWAGIPEDVQEEIDRRERAITDRVNKAAEAERGYGAFRQAITPFEAQLRASGKAIPEALADALTLAHRVRNGTPQERAAALADVISEASQAGVGIDVIDAALAAKLGNQPQAPKPQEFRDPRFDAFLKQMEARERHKTSTEVMEFAAKHEFFADLEPTIAGLLEAKIAKDLPSAYDAALKLHPDISGVMEQRKAAEAARNSQGSTERAQAAASSVRASPVVAGGSAPVGLRDQLASAMASGRR